MSLNNQINDMKLSSNTKIISELEDKCYCKCGDVVNNSDDICGHGVADGKCCICALCRKEFEEEEEEEDE